VSAEWWRVTIATSPAQLDAVAAAVVAMTGQGVEEPAAGQLCTTVDSEFLAREIARSLAAQFSGIDTTVAGTAAVDWSTRWRDGIVQRHFGRLLLTPSWLAANLAPGEVVVTIDPESAFGSGEHGSTRGALALLERHLRPGDRMLDLGSGSGILAIAAATLGARSAIGIEIDDEALPIAEANARTNRVEQVVRFLVGDALALALIAGPAELICSNILRNVNTTLLPVMLQALAPGGTLIFAGMEEPEDSLFRPVLDAHELRVVDETRDAGWWSVAARCR
jgi:ribosomal protein L11 methyltransferase